MTKPVDRYAKRVAHTGRRTLGRQFRMLPDDEGEVRNAIGYMLGVALNRYGILLTVFAGMGNHYHKHSAEPGQPQIGEFFRDFHSLMTRFFNDRQGLIKVSLWDTDKPFDEELLDRESSWDDMLYIVMNPVRAGIVPHPSLYKGLLIGPDDWGKTLRFERPANFFSTRDGGKLPEYVEFTPVPPKGFEGLSLEGLRNRAKKAISRACKKLRRKIEFGSQDDLTIWDTPETARAKRLGLPIEPSMWLGSLRKDAGKIGAFKPKKRFKAASRRLVRLAIERRSRFLADYKFNVKKLPDGEALFPAGTYALRVRGLVKTRPSPVETWFALSGQAECLEAA